MKLKFSKPIIVAIVLITIMISAGTAYAGVALPTITLGGNVDVNGDMEFTSDTTSLTFPATSLPNQPMIEMFKSGTSNADRMVIGHSQDFPTWGLEFRDVGNAFVFKNSSNDVATIDLDTGDTHISGDVTTDGSFGVEIQVIRDQETVTVNSNFIKIMSCPVGFVAISSGVNPGEPGILKDSSHYVTDATGASWIWRFDNPGPGTYLTNFDLVCMKTSEYTFNNIIGE